MKRELKKKGQNNNTLVMSFALYVTYLSLIPSLIDFSLSFQHVTWAQSQKYAQETTEYKPKANKKNIERNKKKALKEGKKKKEEILFLRGTVSLYQNMHNCIIVYQI